MKNTILFLCIVISACTTTKIPTVILPEQNKTVEGYIESGGDPALGHYFYPLPQHFDVDTYGIAVFPHYLRYTRKIRHFGLFSSLKDYAKSSATEDEIAQRYREFVQGRQNVLKTDSKQVNKLITRYVKVQKYREYATHSNLDHALIEYTPSGEPVSMLVRANLFNAVGSYDQLANTYQIQQTFIIFGPRVKTIARKLKYQMDVRDNPS